MKTIIREQFLDKALPVDSLRHSVLQKIHGELDLTAEYVEEIYMVLESEFYDQD